MAMWVAEKCRRYTVCIIHFRTLMSICCFKYHTIFLNVRLWIILKQLLFPYTALTAWRMHYSRRVWYTKTSVTECVLQRARWHTYSVFVARHLKVTVTTNTLLTLGSQVQSQSSPWAICGGQHGAEIVFSPRSSVSQFNYHSTLIHHSSERWTMCPLGSAVQQSNILILPRE